MSNWGLESVDFNKLKEDEGNGNQNDKGQLEMIPEEPKDGQYSERNSFIFGGDSAVVNIF